MEKQTLLSLFEAVRQQTGFEETMPEARWVKKLGPNEYRAVIGHGMYKGTRATLRVSPSEPLYREAHKFQQYSFAAERKGALLVPRVMVSGTHDAVEYVIQDEPLDGDRIISLKKDKPYPYSTEEEKKEAAKLYWETVKIFSSFEQGDSSSMEFLIVRLGTFFEIARANGAVRRGFITDKERDQIAQYLLSSAHELEMKPFFSHFSNTDVVKAQGKYFAQDAEITWRPEAYGAAFWIWGATMYAYDVSPVDWLKEVEEWMDAFVRAAPIREAGRKIHLNLQERMLATLLVDLPLERSPFDALSDSEIMKAKEVVRAVLHLD